MSGRRSHVRFAVAPAAEGVIRVPQDIHVQTNGGSEVVVVSPSPAVVGEHLTLELFEEGSSSVVHVEVAESRPIVVDGVVRHRLRLRIVALSDDADRTPGAMDGFDANENEQ